MGHVKALPYCVALACFGESLNITSERVTMWSVMLELPLPLVFVFGTREWPRALHPRKMEAWGLHIADCYMKEKETSAFNSPSLFFFIFTLSYLFSRAQCWKCAISVRCSEAPCNQFCLIILVPVQDCWFRYLLRLIVILLAFRASAWLSCQGQKGEKTTADSEESVWQ